MNEFTKEYLSITVKYENATREQLHHFIDMIENKKCIYPWESKQERLKRFEELNISIRAILEELGTR